MQTAIDRRATRVVRRLHHDRTFMRRFRAAPHQVLSDAGLTPAQTGAVLSGRPHDLAAAGIDPKRVDRMPVAMLVRARILTVLAAAVAMLAGPLMSSPATAVRARNSRFGIRFIRVGARRLREADVHDYARRTFGRTFVRNARLILPGGGPCESKCIKVELIE